MMCFRMARTYLPHGCANQEKLQKETSSGPSSFTPLNLFFLPALL